MTAVQQTDQRFFAPAFVPIMLVGLMWAIFLIEFELDLDFSDYGLYPRTTSGIKGILTIPFIHGSWSHLINNSLPLLVLGWALFKFYKTIALKTLLWIYILSGIWLWVSGRPSFHIGASGIVYGLAAFLFLSGWLRREKRVAALSLLVTFLYGGLWWGVLPVDPSISWEGHFWGALAGFTLAVLYRKQGPQRPKYRWEMEEEMEDEFEVLNTAPDYEIEKGASQNQENIDRAAPLNIQYTFKPAQKPSGEADQSK